MTPREVSDAEWRWYMLVDRMADRMAAEVESGGRALTLSAPLTFGAVMVTAVNGKPVRPVDSGVTVARFVRGASLVEPRGGRDEFVPYTAVTV